VRGSIKLPRSPQAVQLCLLPGILLCFDLSFAPPFLGGLLWGAAPAGNQTGLGRERMQRCLEKSLKIRRFRAFPTPGKGRPGLSWAARVARGGKDEKNAPTEAVGCTIDGSREGKSGSPVDFIQTGISMRQGISGETPLWSGWLSFWDLSATALTEVIALQSSRRSWKARECGHLL